MGLFSKKTKPSQPSQPVRRSPAPAPTRANNWNRKYGIGDVVRLTGGREMQIGGMDRDWYSGWIKGDPGLQWVTNEQIRGRK